MGPHKRLYASRTFRTLIRELSPAMAARDVQLAYQPKLNLRTGEIDSVEALLRWTHPVLGYIQPNVIIPLAQRAGRLQQLSIWILQQALRDRALLKTKGYSIRFFVNIAASELEDTRFITSLCQSLAHEPDDAIGIEITETSAISNSTEATRNLQLMASCGVTLAIDDYGSGLASLAYVKHLPVSELKIDRQFVSGMTSSHRDPLIVRSTIELAHALQMTIVAEGVESLATLALLRAMGCDYAQGYVVSPPLMLPELASFLDRGDYLTSLEEMLGSIQPPEAFWARVERDPSAGAVRGKTGN